MWSKNHIKMLASITTGIEVKDTVIVENQGKSIILMIEMTVLAEAIDP